MEVDPFVVPVSLEERIWLQWRVNDESVFGSYDFSQHNVEGNFQFIRVKRVLIVNVNDA